MYRDLGRDAMCCQAIIATDRSPSLTGRTLMMSTAGICMTIRVHLRGALTHSPNYCASRQFTYLLSLICTRKCSPAPDSPTHRYRRLEDSSRQITRRKNTMPPSKARQAQEDERRELAAATQRQVASLVHAKNKKAERLAAAAHQNGSSLKELALVSTESGNVVAPGQSTGVSDPVPPRTSHS